MVDTTDPPGDERKRAKFWKGAKGFGRMLVTRQALMIAIRIVTLTVRLAEILIRLFGDL